MTEGGYLALQSVLALVLLVVTAVAGSAPLLLLTFLKKKGKDQNDSGWLSYLSCFSGGVFMATCFLDVMPHVQQTYGEILETYNVEFRLPMNQLFICVGFFFVYLIEEITAKVFGSGGHGHSHGPPIPLTVDIKKEKVTRVQLIENGSSSSPETLMIPIDSRTRHSLVVEETAPWVVSDEKRNLLKSLTFAIAMSFHSLLEGFALGVQDSDAAIWTLFLSLLLHKSIEAFSVGLQISRANTEKKGIVMCTILVYALMTPLGSVLGTLLQNTGDKSFGKDCTIVFLEAMAAGTFIYVTFLEILAAEKENRFNSLKQLLCIGLGFMVILALQFFFGHEGHGHGHPDHGVPSPSALPSPSFSFAPAV
ncbi:Zinc transporter ZIP3 [Caenorhabditis elegans]|uniref:Zinc transporter ZIP3 n=1 Tax=Caenorhabditis elegans TaxID=6239 RepID=Q6BEU0_CAEEL|nr:Zinc transporter ZIP3 [Caenorhabditis elegans]CAH04694.1 Zinc transporter ZIP3 [Caenorhabditis elegans]|eukprot:NP_001026796.1 Zrt (ZRT), Irt-(IRT-) like Protein Transporter [Caenorhabditis elegans]